jgi:hypothetical protein
LTLAQKIINFGSFPNDPSADQIREAFIKIQDNFTELYSDVQNKGVRSLNRTPGEGITVSATTGDVIATANIAQVRIISNTLVVSAGTGVPGSLAVIRNGSVPIVINIPETLSNISNINLSNNLTANTLSVNNSISGSNANFTGTVTLNTVTAQNANVSLLTITGSLSANNLQASSANINTLNASNIAVAGNVSANFFIGNGSQLTGVIASPGPTILNGSSNVNIPTANGNITASVNGNLIANITQTGIVVTGNVVANRFNGILANGGTSNVNITGAGGNINISVAGTSRIIATADGANINGNLDVSGNTTLTNLTVNTIFSTGNVTANRIILTNTTDPSLVVSSNAQIANLNASLLQGYSVDANAATPGTIVARNNNGNIVVNGISGNGAGLTNILGNNVIGPVNQSNTANTVTGNNQPNITSVGTLTGLTVQGNVSLTGHTINLGQVANLRILGGAPGKVLATDGNGVLSWQSAAAASTAITVIGNDQPNITSVGTLTSLNVSGNISAGNINANSGTISAASLVGTLLTNAQPNITSLGNLGNLTVTNNVNMSAAMVDLGDLTTLKILGGLPNQVIKTDGAGNLFWTTVGKAENVIYVSKSGNDSNPGNSLDNAKLTIKAAVALATPGTVIFVKAGDYTEDNPISVPERVSIIGDNLRSVTVRPANPTQDIFHVRNGVYLYGMTFRDHLSPAAAVAFPSGGAGNIFTSPYVQGCSSITTTGCGMRVDGNLAGGLKSMVTDSYTQFNQGGIGIHIINEGYAQLVSIFTICCSIGVLCETGGQCSIANSNNAFGDYGLVADGVSSPKYTGFVDSFINGQVVVSGLSQRPAVNDAFRFAGDTNWYTVREATPLVGGVSIIKFSQPPGNTPANGTVVIFHQPSLISASGQTFEYVGSGTNLLTATPRLGGVPIQENEVRALNGGIVNWTSTDHYGDFRIGPGLVIEKEAGTISGQTFERGLFAVLTPYILALEGGN